MSDKSVISGVLFCETCAKNRARMSQAAQECPNPRPEGLVTSVAQLGLYS